MANDFWVQQIGGRTLGLGTVALSLLFLAAFGGMLSLGQMALADVAGYAVAYFTAPVAGVGLLLPWPAAVVIALGLSTLAGLLVGLISVRTSGIYTLMLTLAIAMGFYYLALQNYALFNGFTGFTQVAAPSVPGLSLESPRAFYWLCLAAALACYALVTFLATTPFSLALQATRDNPRRLAALGFHVASIRWRPSASPGSSPAAASTSSSSTIPAAIAWPGAVRSPACWPMATPTRSCSTWRAKCCRW
ncbi:branched-chain amino acid ABC transporter permease [Ancylobacter pratisalsi]|uniref:Branched-chain amino acid ABC transporter permease n=1 Tax=Ancylobacter pratisalsi TaxID=1745854 RepID=A0A6P1YWN4_9HYPH|nr:branched-chain amino acid ABC transporter permease [Ancylobacter pratisalsi]